MRRTGAAAVAAAVWLLADTARADEPAGPGASPPVTLGDAGASKAPGSASAEPGPEGQRGKALPTVAAVVPGVVLHGAGHYVAGHKKTAGRLLAAEGVGFGLLGVTGTLLAATGASRRIVGYLVAGGITGGALFVLPLLADLYGVMGPSDARPVTVAPWLEARVGVSHVYDPQFRYRWLATQGLDGRLGAWKLGASGSFALDDSNGQLRFTAGRRLWGPGPGAPSRDGSYLDLDLGVSRHGYESDRFTLWTGEVMAQGRLDLARVGPTLRGSFAELGLGWALQGTTYDVKGAQSDATELALGRFAFGMYLGRPGATNGELSLGYDHRHDGYAAGLKVTGLGSGVAGHFELRGKVFWGDWGLGGEAQAGSAYVVGLSLLHRQGGPW